MKKLFVVLFCIFIVFICFSGCIDIYNIYNRADDNFIMDYNNYDNNNEQISNDDNYNIMHNTSNNNEYYKTDYYTRSYNWKYKRDSWSWDLSIPVELHEYYKNKPHNREENYAQYALSDYDRPYLDSMVEGFKEASSKNGYSDYDTVMFIVSFVQSLKYTSDSTTTGYDEYPRYPVETLIDEGGDCEDTAILTAALLSELGYDVVLVELPQHMAVGIAGGDDITGTYYLYNNKKYYYLETTNTGWDIGTIPEEYKNKNAIIRPMIQIPNMDISFKRDYIDYNRYYVYYNISCNIKNIGSGTAKNPKLYICALALDEGEGYIWKPDHTIDLENYPEGSSGEAYAVLRIPRGKTTQIKCVLYGDNFKSVEVYSEVFNT
ncbi:transglutaminase-like domain-containing protein [Methanococcus aeolicus]|uniref:transglutaminase-like domain-containing protein n=1 Tax=Methanococcus aeolicus TaxID=42879 RepID=UPI0021C88CD2|nr:transglutaminase-like domain-containing protein [Methanococcus aeolicus]UXM84922.1 hypothetical protein N6C89_01180 [Methanococcus aeolicus]